MIRDWMLLILVCVLIVEGHGSQERRINTLEMRVNGIESRVNSDSRLTVATLISMEKDIGALNISLVNLKDEMCPKVKTEYDEVKTSLEHPNGMSSFTKTLIKKGLGDEKRWMRDEMKSIENNLHKEISNQLEKCNSTTEKVITKVNKMIDDFDRKLDAAISEVISSFDAKIIKRDQNLDELKLEFENFKLKQVVINAETEEMKQSLGVVSTCPDGWSKFEAFCYLYINEFLTYVSARETCSKFGAHVADIQSLSENDFVYNLCNDNGHEWSPTWNKGSVWIGFTDVKTEDVWVSDRTGQTNPYMNWRPGQPDSNRQQNCLMMGFQDPFDKWNDWQCAHTDQKAQFVCKKEL